MILTVPSMPPTDGPELTAMQIRVARLGHLVNGVDIDTFDHKPSDSDISFHVGGRRKNEYAHRVPVGPDPGKPQVGGSWTGSSSIEVPASARSRIFCHTTAGIVAPFTFL